MKSKPHCVIFADLNSPKIANYTADGISNNLEQIASEGFEYFSPNNLGFYFLGNMAGMNPDSEYGNRMDLTQKIIASALYSGEKLAQYFRDVSSENEQKSDAEEIKYQSKSYRLTKSIKLIPEKIRRFFGLGRTYLDPYVCGELERESIAEKRVLIDVYTKLADTVEMIVNEFGKQNVQAIIELAELNHFFSGEKNRTNQDITFTNPKLRYYGAEIQQQIHRAWYRGIIEDSFNPLSEQQLLPYKK
jgi:hypothetical protein